MPEARPFRIGDRRVAPDEPPYVIAEAGVNHNGDLGLAKELVRAARRTGADAVKFQTFRTEKLVSRYAPRAAYQERNAGAGTQEDLLRPLELAERDFQVLSDLARDEGITFLSTPFDDESVDVLARLGVPAFKVGSGDLTNHPLLRRVAAAGRPMVVSTGMATLEEVRDAARALDAAGARYMLLHCTSDYPARPSDLNLRAIPLLRAEMGVEVGYSDHTTGSAAAVAAVALGATLVEKHLTLDRTLPGPDHKASLEPDAFAAYVRDLREAHESLGRAVKEPSPREADTARVARKSVVARRAVEPGRPLVPDDLDVKRPGTGVPPKHLDALVGRRARRRLEPDQPIQWDDLEGGAP